MNNLSISAKFLKSHLLELKSSDGFQDNKITHFGLFNDYFYEFTPVCLENRYYQDRNIWVVCIISFFNKSISIDDIDNTKDIEPGFDFDQILAFLGNNLDKPVYFYTKNTFYPIYKTDIVKWNGLLGFLNGWPNHLKESTDDKPLEGVDALIKKAKYRVSIDKFQTENGLSDPHESNEPHYYYFSNLISAKLFYNKVVASFMESTPSDYKTNFDQFSTNSLSWRGIRTFKDVRFGDSVIIGDNLFIEIRSIKMSYDWIEGEFDLI